MTRWIEVEKGSKTILSNDLDGFNTLNVLEVMNLVISKSYTKIIFIARIRHINHKMVRLG